MAQKCPAWVSLGAVIRGDKVCAGSAWKTPVSSQWSLSLDLLYQSTGEISGCMPLPRNQTGQEERKSRKWTKLTKISRVPDEPLLMGICAWVASCNTAYNKESNQIYSRKVWVAKFTSGLALATAMLCFIKCIQKPGGPLEQTCFMFQQNRSLHVPWRVNFNAHFRK